MIMAIAPWFGSKRTLSPKIITALGKHSSYWEPFCGSMAVLLAKPPSSFELVNDLHGDLINLALVIQNEELATQLYSIASRTLCHEEILQESRQRLQGMNPPNETAPDVYRAAAYLIISWLGMNGIAGTEGCEFRGAFAVRWNNNGGNSATRWRSVTESIPDWHHRLRNVQIIRRDGFAVLESIKDADGAVIYVDPPYITKSAKYLYDFNSDDHTRLSQLLNTRFKKARVVVSYYAHEQLVEYYQPHLWSMIDCTSDKKMTHTTDKKEKSESPEVLLVNRMVEDI